MFKILIVDDTKAVHSFVKALLQKSNEVQTESAFNGSEALTKIKGDNKYDLILLDWEMPVLNGPETLAQIKPIAGVAPIIMMTTKNKPEDIQNMLIMGASEYLMKPFTIDILFDKISFVTGKSFEYAA